jgi:chromosomal replication initiator protein
VPTRFPADDQRRIKVHRSTPDAARDELTVAWEQIQRELRASMPSSTYGFWFEPLRPVSARGATLFVTGPRHARRWVARRYPELLRAALQRSGTGLRELEFIDPDDAPASEAAPRAVAGARVALNPANTFERFVIGPGNRVAHGAALAVAEAPGESYNPLFLHGPPGLGKTHLLGAIANYLHVNSPNLSVHYTTAEAFTNEFVGALQTTGIEAFKERYRRADVLLIDDIQFLEGKERTADEFFHTFNALHESGSQLVLTADRLPGALVGLAARIRDRFEWGLVASLEPPDLTTRLLFLANLVRERSEDVAPEAVRAIASRATSNLRLLEGALTRVVALSSLTGSEVSPDSVDQALPGAIEEPPPATPGVEQIQRLVADRLEVPVDEMLSRSRRAAPVARARQLAMYLSRELTDLSLPAIASAFNRSDHTTVMHAIRRVEERSLADPALARTLEQLSGELRGGAKDRDRTD